MPSPQSSNDDFWASVNDTSNLMTPPPPRPYHYLTRSQSLGSYQPKHQQQQNQQHVSATQQPHASASTGYGNMFGFSPQQQHAYQAQAQSHVPAHHRQLQQQPQQRQEQQQHQQQYHYPYQYGQGSSGYDPREHEPENEHGDEHDDEHGDDEHEDGMMGGMGFADPGMRSTHGFGMWEAPPPNRPLSPIDEGALSYSDADSPTGGIGGPGGVGMGGPGGTGVGGNGGGAGGAGGQVNNDDAVSVHSTHSSLFLRRPVRRTTSSNTITSVTSAPARFSPTDTPHTGPPRTFKRSAGALSVIPQSPRASQMSHADGSQPTAMPQPPPPAVIYPQHLSQHPSFHQTLEEAIDRHARLVTGYGEYDSDIPPNNMSTPSLVSRTESVHTQITYATDSAMPSRRQSTVPVEGGNGSSESKVGVAAKLKGSLNTFMTKSHKLASATKSSLHLRTPLSAKVSEGNLEEGRHYHQQQQLQHDGNADNGMAPRDSRRFSIASWRKSLRDTSNRSKPSEFLFWTGFIAPWCWLIGGWMLADNGEPIVEGFPKDAKGANLKAENMNRHPSTMSILPLYNDANYASRAPVPYGQGEKEFGVGGHYGAMSHVVGGPSSSQHPTYTFPEPETFPPPSFHASPLSDSKLEPISSTPMPMPNQNQVPDSTDPYMYKAHQASVSRFPVPGRPVFMMRNPKVKLRSVKAVQARMKHDPWVVRCRVMAIVSGMVILALVIIAFIVLIRAL